MRRRVRGRAAFRRPRGGRLAVRVGKPPHGEEEPEDHEQLGKGGRQDHLIRPVKVIDPDEAVNGEAQKQQENGEDEQAIALAEQSTLEYKLAIATAERDEAVKEDERLEKELRGDVERKLIYQSIRDQETKNGGAQ